MLARSTRLDLQRANILLVDDSSQSLELISQMLMGFRVKNIKPCRSAREARELLPRHRFDMMVVDADLPSEDGLSLVEEIRQNTEDLNHTAPIMVVSGFTPFLRVMQARDAGANIVVKKPIAPSILLSRIEWLARNGRDFVTSDTYRGPDRRFRNLPLPEGVEERRADALALAATPEREMSQDDIDSLFN